MALYKTIALIAMFLFIGTIAKGIIGYTLAAIF